LDKDGNLYVASENGHVIYRLTPGVSGTISVVAGKLNAAGFLNGVPGTGTLYAPRQVAIGSDGSLYIADYNNQRVRKVAGLGDGVVATNGSMISIAGGGVTPPAAGVAATAANLGRISGVAVDPDTDEVYFTDFDGQRVWKIAQSGPQQGQLVAVAGNGVGGYNGDQADQTTPQTGTPAQLYNPARLKLYRNFLYIADQYNHRIRRVTTDVATLPLVTVAGTTSAGFSGDGDAAIVSTLYYPMGVATDGTGNLFIADQYNHRIREI